MGFTMPEGSALTTSADFLFVPKVWKDHISAFFRRKMIVGSFAVVDDSLTSAPGTTVNFPYFKKIGAAAEASEGVALVVDKLSDDSFSVSVKEVAKAVGITKTAFKTSAARQDTITSEIQQQIARVMAEKVDADLIVETNATGNFVAGFTATAAADVMNVTTLNKARIAAFGDQFQDAAVCFMHSLQFMDLMNSSPAGFLQANANDPMFLVQGFSGRLLGMALVVLDNIGLGAVVDGKQTYKAQIHKQGSYGIMIKQDMEVESDYDLLHREWVFSGNQWYGVKSFHGKISAQDLKSAQLLTTTTA